MKKKKKTVSISTAIPNEELLGSPKNGKFYTYEECYPHIKTIILQRKPRWFLKIPWMDYEDVMQIILLHFYLKWHQWDQTKPLLPWVNRIVTNQTINAIRNNWGSFVTPCKSCAANEGDNLCRIYQTQCAQCPIYAKWEKNKKDAQAIKLADSYEELEGHTKTLSINNTVSYEDLNKIHNYVLSKLKPSQRRAYQLLYIEHKDEEETAIELGYTSNEKYRKVGYKMISNLKKIFIQKAKMAIQELDI